jgi:hypothetical protein
MKPSTLFFQCFKLDIFSISYQQAVVVEHWYFPNTEISSLKMSLPCSTSTLLTSIISWLSSWWLIPFTAHLNLSLATRRKNESEFLFKVLKNILQQINWPSLLAS